MKLLLCVSMILGFTEVMLAEPAAPSAKERIVSSYQAQLFADGSDRQKLVYRKTSKTVIKNGRREIHNVFYYADEPEKIAVEETAVFIDDDEQAELEEYFVKHHQLLEDWRIKFKNSKAHFSKKKWSSETVDSDSEEIKGHFLVGPVVHRLLQNEWQKILDEKTISVRFAVPARKETVGFKIYKVFPKKGVEADKVVLKMKPSSFFIALLVDPFLITLKKDGSQIISTKGFNLPRKLVGGKWKDAVVDTVFVPKSNAQPKPKADN